MIDPKYIKNPNEVLFSTGSGAWKYCLKHGCKPDYYRKFGIYRVKKSDGKYLTYAENSV